MSYHDFPTHLGGEVYTNPDGSALEWEELTAHELALSAAGTTVKAAAIAILAYEQTEAAHKQGDTQQEATYKEVADRLARAGRYESLSSTLYPLPRMQWHR